MSKKSDCPKNQRIQVFARCRPMNSMEIGQGSTSMMEIMLEMNKLVLKDRKTSKEYLFDQVFSPDSDQIIVYEAVVGPLIEEVLLGYSCTVFAYGQTGTGKTYTMEGEKHNAKCSWKDDPAAGIIPRSLHQVFEELNQAENVEFSVKVSFFEIYNEEVYDLLSSSDFSKLRLYEDTSLKDSVKIRGLEEVPIKTEDEVYTILEKSAAKRHTAETKLNACSSRSHTVFTVTVGVIEKTSKGIRVEKTGKLNLVDLAGSENVRRSGAIDKRVREAGSINQSLLTLGRVITALIEKQAHVPYRESKLTRILQYSLGGRAKTSIIATISPALCNLDETIKTLDYVAKAKAIDINPELNRRMLRKGLIKELTTENDHLRMENEVLARDLAAARNSSGFFVNGENHECMVQKITLLESENEVLKAKNSKLLQEAVIATNGIEELHAKIRRTQTVAYANEDLCGNLRLLSQKQCADLYNMVADYDRERIKFSKCFKDEQDHVNCVLRELKQKTNCFRETLANNLQLLLDDFLSHLNGQTTCENQWANDVSRDLKSTKDSLVSECDKFLTQRLPSLLDDLKAEKAAMGDKITNMYLRIKETVIDNFPGPDAAIPDFSSNIQSFTKCQKILDSIHNSVQSEKIKASEQKEISVSLCLQMTDVLKGLQKLQIDNYKKGVTNFKSHDSAVHENTQSNNHKVNGIITAFSKQIDTDFKYLDEKLVVALDTLAHSGDIVDESEKCYSNVVSQLQKATLENDLEIENFVSEAFVKDIPTGTTPQQRTRHSPGNLTSSQYRSFHAKNKISTPLKGNDESNCSDISSFINSQDISFASDIVYSDRYESYSAIMSEIHYDDEDKENQKENNEVSSQPRRKSVRFSETSTTSESMSLNPHNHSNFEVDRE